MEPDFNFSFRIRGCASQALTPGRARTARKPGSASANPKVCVDLQKKSVYCSGSSPGRPSPDTPFYRKEAPHEVQRFFHPQDRAVRPKVREQAVLECKDKELLKRVIQNDKDEHVRQAAMQRLAALGT